MTTMTLCQVRESIREDAKAQRTMKHYYTARLMDDWAEAIDAHLAKGAQDIVPTEMNWEEAYSLGKTIDYMNGWNDCRRVTLHALVPNETKP